MKHHIFQRFRGFLLTLPAGFLALGLLTAAAPAGSADTSVLDLDAYSGKVVVVDFWASWCVPCRRSFPWLNEMQARYADAGLVIIGVNVDASADDAHQFLDEVPADFDVRFDPAGDIARDFEVIAMPSTYVFDRSGALQARHLGFKISDRDDYERTLRELLDHDDGSTP